MEQYNLILILDKNITAVAATERNRSDIITVCGEDSIPLRGENSIDEVIENIKEHYSILDFNDKCINTIIIKNGASEKLAVYTLEKCDGSADRNIVNMLALAPMLVRNKGLDLPATISLNGIGYCIDENGVALTDNTDTATEITYDDLLFLFWVKPELLSDNSAELKKANDELKWYRRENAEQSNKIDQLEKNHEQEVSNFKVQLDKKNKEISDIKKKCASFDVDNDADFRDRLKDYIGSDITLNDFSISRIQKGRETEIRILHKKSGVFARYTIDSKTANPEHIFTKTAFSVVKIHQIVEHNSEKYEVGECIKFGRYRQDSTNKPKEIEWIVLDIKDSKALLISKYGIDTKPYNDTDRQVDWVSCSLRKWLNDGFYNSAFNESEKKQIVNSVHYDGMNQILRMAAGIKALASIEKPDYDKVFILNKEEAKSYFSGKDARLCLPTEFAKNNKPVLCEDGTTEWWYRDEKGSSDSRGYHYWVGFFRVNEYLSVEHGLAVVRPAIWISL